MSSCWSILRGSSTSLSMLTAEAPADKEGSSVAKAGNSFRTPVHISPHSCACFSAPQAHRKVCNPPRLQNWGGAIHPQDMLTHPPADSTRHTGGCITAIREINRAQPYPNDVGALAASAGRSWSSWHKLAICNLLQQCDMSIPGVLQTLAASKPVTRMNFHITQ